MPQQIDADNGCARLQPQLFGNLRVRTFDGTANEAPAHDPPGGSDDLGEARPCANGISKTFALDVGSAAALSANQASFRERGDGTAYGMAVHAEARGKIELAGQLGPGLKAPGRDAALELIGDAAPKRDAC